MQHTKVSEVQCFSRSLVIERFHPAPPPWTEKVPAELQDQPWFLFCFFSRTTLPAQDRDTCWAHISLHRGQDTWQGIARG